MIGPPFVDTDLSLLKRFQSPEPWGALQRRLETFNIFNNVSFNNPNNTLISPAFEKIQGAQPARIIQLGLRYDFLEDSPDVEFLADLRGDSRFIRDWARDNCFRANSGC